jgi:predicted Rossmann fold nucleotide-binding protein DprA/Smf involved in DNA uptake
MNNNNSNYNNEAAYWLALVNQSGLKLSQVKPIAQQWQLMEGKSIVELFNLSAAEASVRFALTEAEAQGMLKAAETHAAQLALLEKWQSQGIELLTLSHPHYPLRLVYSLPPKHQPVLLWARGNPQILSEPTITVLGNPEPNDEVVEFINKLSTLLVEENIVVVSGYGKGLDRFAFEAMLAEDQGHAVAVLPMGLSAFARLTTKLDPAVAADQAVLLSPFAPEMDYKDSLAEARNLLVDSLALALLVPEAEESFLPRVQAALDRGLPVLVGMKDSPENRALISRGAFLMTDPGEVVEMVQQAIIDDAMQAQLAQTPAAETRPVGQPTAGSALLGDDDDYTLPTEALEPLEAQDALEIFSSMGTVPGSLRDRLMAIEREQQESKDKKK